MYAARVCEITSTNRHYPGIMYGGWGPHLRGLMRTTDGSLWFVCDQGPDVLHNDQIIYHRFDGRTWHEVTRQNHLFGIQQNVASVMVDDRIFSYGVSIREPRYLEECELDTRDTTKWNCRPVLIDGKPLLLPGSCNYVGAAVSPSGRKLVWWTTVGVNGAEGSWSYVYQSNNEWKGPVISALNGYNDFSYIYAAFLTETNVSLAGQLYAGAYPHGSFALGCVEFALGETIRCIPFDTNTPNCGKSASDIWLYKGGTHVIAETHNSEIACYYKPPVQRWENHEKPVCVLTNIFRARFLESGGEVFLITGGATNTNEGVGIRRIRKSQISGAVDWAALPEFRIPMADPALAAPSAIFVESCSYQTAKVRGVNFAVCGHYPGLDNRICHVELKER